jgi:hypothetical protein
MRERRELGEEPEEAQHDHRRPEPVLRVAPLGDQPARDERGADQHGQHDLELEAGGPLVAQPDDGETRGGREADRPEHDSRCTPPDVQVHWRPSGVLPTLRRRGPRVQSSTTMCSRIRA